MNDDQQNTVLSNASVFGLPDEPPITALHYCYWLLASGRTLLDGFSVVSLGIAISAEGFMRFCFAIPPLRAQAQQLATARRNDEVLIGDNTQTFSTKVER
jgi:hypothetical protein